MDGKRWKSVAIELSSNFKLRYNANEITQLENEE